MFYMIQGPLRTLKQAGQKYTNLSESRKIKNLPISITVPALSFQKQSGDPIRRAI